MQDIYILGVGHNTIVYIDLVESCGYNVAGLYHYEKGRNGDTYFGHKIIGDNESLFSSNLSGKQFAISVGDNKIRSSLYQRVIECGGTVPTIIHPSAIVSKYAQVENGVIVHANSVVSPDVIIEENSVVNSNSLVAHSSKMGKHCFIASNAVLGAYVTMKDYAFVGFGAIIISGKVSYIGQYAIVGAGAVVVSSVEDNSVVVGNPARKIK